MNRMEELIFILFILFILSNLLLLLPAHFSYPRS